MSPPQSDLAGHMHSVKLKELLGDVQSNNGDLYALAPLDER
jgi:hypothetical protein